MIVTPKTTQEKANDIAAEYAFLREVDEMIFNLKSLNTPLILSLRKHLNNFLKENKLDGDQHNFVDIPAYLKRKGEDDG